MSIGSPEELQGDRDNFLYYTSQYYEWRKKNRRAEIICFKNNGRHLFLRREKWLLQSEKWFLVRYNKFRRTQILLLENEEIVFKHGAHLDSSRGVKSPVRIFLFRRYANKKHGVFSSVNCKEITIPVRHHCYIAVYRGRVISSLLLHFVG